MNLDMSKKNIMSGQIIATSHGLGPQNGGDCKGNGTPYFRET